MHEQPTEQSPSAHVARQLDATCDAFASALSRFPTDLLYRSSPRHPDDWPAARHAFHLLTYERTIALPSMRQWLGGPPPDSLGPDDDAAREDAAWNSLPREGAAPLLAALRAVRDEQIALLPSFTPAQWDERLACVWGAVTLRWVATKTLQHTHEHTHDVLRLLLWWADPPLHPEDV